MGEEAVVTQGKGLCPHKGGSCAHTSKGAVPTQVRGLMGEAAVPTPVRNLLGEAAVVTEPLVII